MKPTKIFALGWLIGCLCWSVATLSPTLLTGCGTLAPAGVYAGDKFLYDADYAIASAYDLMHQFVTWEYQNRDALRSTPEVKQYADKVRAGAKQWISSALAVRDAYAASPNASTKSDLQKALDTLREVLVQITKYRVGSAAPLPASHSVNQNQIYESL